MNFLRIHYEAGQIFRNRDLQYFVSDGVRRSGGQPPPANMAYITLYCCFWLCRIRVLYIWGKLYTYCIQKMGFSLDISFFYNPSEIFIPTVYNTRSNDRNGTLKLMSTAGLISFKLQRTVSVVRKEGDI